MSKIKLFCFPYAGGSTQIYQPWANRLNSQIEIIPIELSGRGRRINESLYKDFDELVNDVFNQIQNDIIQTPYAFFGHSLGALIAFELVQKIVTDNLPPPKHVFYSGKSAPNSEQKRKFMFHLLDTQEFKQELIKLGGTPPELFKHKELEDLFLPVIKNDFKLSETYTFKVGRKLYDGEITVFLGKEDNWSAGGNDEWHNCSSGTCNIIYLEGGHFFIHNEAEAILKTINNVLLT
jgi:surfactin synthase thioesterase subunit